MTNKQKILIVIIAVVVAVLGLVFLFIPKTLVTFAVAPQQVNIQIDGGKTQRVANTDKLSISPGTHTISVSEDEFEPYQTTVLIKKGETQEFLVALTANTPAAQERLSDATSQAIVQRFHGKTMTKEINQITKNNPIINDLPIEARLYRIYSCKSILYPNDETKIGVCVDSNIDTATIKPYIEKEITSRGYKVADLEMIYTSDGRE